MLHPVFKRTRCYGGPHWTKLYQLEILILIAKLRKRITFYVFELAILILPCRLLMPVTTGPGPAASRHYLGNLSSASRAACTLIVGISRARCSQQRARPWAQFCIFPLHFFCNILHIYIMDFKKHLYCCNRVCLARYS